MQADKMRVYVLAKTLDVESKLLLDVCKELGYDIKNQLSSLDHDQVEVLKERFTKGAKPTTPAIVPPSPAVNPSAPITQRVVNLDQPRRPAPLIPPPTPIDHNEPPKPVAPVTPAPPATKPPEAAPVVQPAATIPPPAAKPNPAPTALPQPVAQAAPPSPSRAPLAGDQRVRNLSNPGPRPQFGTAVRPPSPPAGSGPSPGQSQIRSRPIIRKPTSIGAAPRPQQSLRQPGAQPKGAPAPVQARKLAEIPRDLLNKGRDITVDQVMRGQAAAGIAPVAPIVDDDEGADGRKGAKKTPSGPGGPGTVGGRDIRRAQRNERAKDRKTDNQVEVEGGRVTLIENERQSRLRSRVKARSKHRQPGTQPRKGKVTIDLPITIRALSEAIGVGFNKLVPKLVELGLEFGSFTINSILEPDMAELVAVDNGCELEIRRVEDAEEKLMAVQQEPDDPTKLKPRAPIVTIMGHVDHGKTSLLDRIRKSNVVDTEAGGITQVIRAWRVEHHGKWITFLDTPGHEAFTKMRARGAQVTDIAVIVCAADDGVMPQTEEAINHAKAAGVKIVVAINKVDLPNANLAKTRQQLYSLNLLPDNMGGDVPFIETSAAKNVGISELLEAISLVAELQLDLKANPDKPGRGTCLESHVEGNEGVFATLMVQDGTLKKGDVVLCGPAHGRVRAMYDDAGHPIESAGPSVPVRITGLDEAPNADDAFHVVDDIAKAREIAEKRHTKMQADFRGYATAAKSFGEAGGVKVSELKVILKADFRGSVEAIRKELEKLVHDEVRVRVLHTGVGGITASDVQLAMTSPNDSMIVGFNSVPDDDALSLAEQNGIPIREYNIIYNLTNDIRAALEGKLKPKEEVIHLGRAVVRELFKISKIGVVAGCHVTQGTIERSAKVRIIRGGVVVYPPAERTVGLESLKRHKDDAREVNQGYDCGIKVAGYDDIKVDDVIEAYRVEQVQRTL